MEGPVLTEWIATRVHVCLDTMEPLVESVSFVVGFLEAYIYANAIYSYDLAQIISTQNTRGNHIISMIKLVNIIRDENNYIIKCMQIINDRILFAIILRY
jgi:hypothetical protein